MRLMAWARNPHLDDSQTHSDVEVNKLAPGMKPCGSLSVTLAVTFGSWSSGWKIRGKLQKWTLAWQGRRCRWGWQHVKDSYPRVLCFGFLGGHLIHLESAIISSTYRTQHLHRYLILNKDAVAKRLGRPYRTLHTKLVLRAPGYGGVGGAGVPRVCSVGRLHPQ